MDNAIDGTTADLGMTADISAGVWTTIEFDISSASYLSYKQIAFQTGIQDTVLFDNITFIAGVPVVTDTIVTEDFEEGIGTWTNWDSDNTLSVTTNIDRTGINTSDSVAIFTQTASWGAMARWDGSNPTVDSSIYTTLLVDVYPVDSAASYIQLYMGNSATGADAFTVGASNIPADTWTSVSFSLKNMTVWDYQQLAFQSGNHAVMYFDNIRIVSVDTLASDATLSNIETNDGTLSPTFSAEDTAYTVTLTAGTTDVPTITPTASDENASITIDTAEALTDTTVITVTAEDSITQKTYYVSFTVTMSSDATLSKIETNDGTLSPTFSAEDTAYTVTLAEGTTDVPTITPTANYENASISIDTAEALTDTTFITVTAEDGITQKTYYVSFTVTTSSDATLTSITPSVGTLTPSFTATRTDYVVELPAGTTTVPTFTYTTSNTGASVSVYNATNLYNDTTSITVTAEDSVTTEEYRIQFYVLSNDTTLSNINAGDLSLDPTFSADVFEYTITLAAGTTTVPTISATATDDSATVVVTAAATLGDKTEILVTAEDGSTGTYYVSFYVLSDDATLGNILTNAGTLSPSFDAGTTVYVVSLDAGTTEVPTITATAVDDSATVAVTAATDLAGTTTVVVTAEDGTEGTTYTISFSVPTNIEELKSDIVSIQAYSVTGVALGEVPSVGELEKGLYILVITKGDGTVETITLKK